jgi:hypothetical protein
MGKYSNIEDDIFSIFGSAAWKLCLVKTVPSNFVASNVGSEYIRISSVVSPGINRLSNTGILFIDIFTKAGEGSKRATQIADLLNDFLENKSKTTISQKITQFSNSNLSGGALDVDNPTLWKTTYNISFNFYGV